ncbi:hypothetical protein [Micromonospora sp. CPCC 206061]|uniref:hypothetical protein n=1 Tax=Micromonospora sp. CPCC 206061 TaxID=3122410 RepID=UPI003FA59CE1
MALTFLLLRQYADEARFIATRMQTEFGWRGSSRKREPGEGGCGPYRSDFWINGEAELGRPTVTSRCGTAVTANWDRLHPRLTRRTCWICHHGDLPVIEGTLIRLQVEHLPGDRDPKPLWLWCSATDATAADIDRWWQSFRRRFDLEHTFRLFKQSLGWTRPKLRTPYAADRWTWLIIAAHTQLRLARPLAADLRRPWERPTPPGRLTPPAFAAGFGTSARPPLCQPAHRNPPNPARDGLRLAEPTTRTPPRRRQNRQARPDHHRLQPARRLENKLRSAA